MSGPSTPFPGDQSFTPAAEEGEFDSGNSSPASTSRQLVGKWNWSKEM
jgi:hypothetical protein